VNDTSLFRSNDRRPCNRPSTLSGGRTTTGVRRRLGGITDQSRGPSPIAQFASTKLFLRPLVHVQAHASHDSTSVFGVPSGGVGRPRPAFRHKPGSYSLRRPAEIRSVDKDSKSFPVTNNRPLFPRAAALTTACQRIKTKVILRRFTPGKLER